VVTENGPGDSGRLPDALRTAREAVDFYRHMIELDPDTYLPHLALSLHKLGRLFGEAGQ
jgi:hypothetical protein